MYYSIDNIRRMKYCCYGAQWKQVFRFFRVAVPPPKRQEHKLIQQNKMQAASLLLPKETVYIR